jgi:hypothetical protein
LDPYSPLIEDVLIMVQKIHRSEKKNKIKEIPLKNEKFFSPPPLPTFPNPHPSQILVCLSSALKRTRKNGSFPYP